MMLAKNLNGCGAWALGLTLTFAIGCAPEGTSSAPLAESTNTSAAVEEPAATTAPAATPAAAVAVEDPPEPALTEPVPAEATPPMPAELPPAAAAQAQPASDANPMPGGAASRPKADRTPRRPGEAEKITFDDLIIGMQANIVYRPWMLLERPQELEGTRVRISGYMHPGADGTSGIKEFVLLRNKECKFGKDGQADHLTRVFLREGTKTNYIADSIVEGTLRIDPYTGTDGNTWSIYTLEDAVMK